VLGVLLLAALLAGCGGSSSSSPSTTAASKPSPAAQTAAWTSSVKQLCVQKRAAIARLGNVHITYAGIARVGLPAVKRDLEAYLGRLQAVLREFAARRRALTTPPSLVSTVQGVDQIDDQSTAATRRLQAAVARVGSASELSAAFRTWLATLQGLVVRGNSLAQQLNLVPECGSSGPNAGPVA
jgi:hypothetical protein